MSDQPLTHRRPARLRARALGVGGAAVAVAVGGLYYLSRGRKAEDEEPAPPALREPVVGDADPWEPYRPDRQSPWDQRRVVHLHRRAGFAATWDELQRDLRDGPEASVGRLLDGNARAAVAEGVAEDADRLAQLAAAAGNSDRLAASWVYRMLCGRDPLTERLTLFWHGHFATSATKVGMAVHRQNAIFRRLARAPFGDLLGEVVRDPALLLYLDAQANRRDGPNENLARELMELFTLGIGHFTEADVREAARALTGWTVAGGQFREEDALHDPGEKTVLARTGHWRGGDLLRILLEHPATARRLAERLCGLYFGEGGVPEAGVRALAVGLGDRRLDVGWAVATVLRSRAFFAETNLGSRVLGPVEYVVGAARALQLLDPSPNTLVLAAYAADLGQRLFAPPNVGGWPGGRAWLTTRAGIGRANYAAALLRGEDVGLTGPVDALGLARRHGQGADWPRLLDFYGQLLLGGPPDAAWRRRLLTALGVAGAGQAPDAAGARRLVALILASPEGQLL